jgi:hypothetical protein
MIRSGNEFEAGDPFDQGSWRYIFGFKSKETLIQVMSENVQKSPETGL